MIASGPNHPHRGNMPQDEGTTLIPMTEDMQKAFGFSPQMRLRDMQAALGKEPALGIVQNPNFQFYTQIATQAYAQALMNNDPNTPQGKRAINRAKMFLDGAAEDALAGDIPGLQPVDAATKAKVAALLSATVEDQVGAALQQQYRQQQMAQRQQPPAMGQPVNVDPAAGMPSPQLPPQAVAAAPPGRGIPKA